MDLANQPSNRPCSLFHPGALAGAQYQTLPVFNLQVPTACPGVPSELLLPSSSWADGAAYERELRQLAQRFVSNFERFLVSLCLCGSWSGCVGSEAHVLATWL